ncbi:MAG: hypothetical protein DMF88_19195 [Acidobacteria bacterium]|nr:MAG: hypothetical protein DMF88_19195 [Acidobacteriota bacterium]
MRALACLVAIIVSAALLSAQRARTLDIYVVDVEGGNATLFVSPSGESLLIDTGNAGAAAARDAGRIIEAAKDAGVTQIDHLITTHWHGDHYGGLAELAMQMPIKQFIDHGKNIPHRRQSRRHDPVQGRGDPRHRVSGSGDCQAAAGRGQAESILRADAAARSDSRRHTVGDDLLHLREVSRAAPGRPDARQGERPGVPRQSRRHRGPARRPASRPGHVERRAVRARAAAARDRDEQRHAQGWLAGRDAVLLHVSSLRGSLANALLAAERAGIHATGCVHRQRCG